jgi:hypothetical protein
LLSFLYAVFYAFVVAFVVAFLGGCAIGEEHSDRCYDDNADKQTDNQNFHVFTRPPF